MAGGGGGTAVRKFQRKGIVFKWVKFKIAFHNTNNLFGTEYQVVDLHSPNHSTLFSNTDGSKVQYKTNKQKQIPWPLVREQTTDRVTAAFQRS
jgi:hypothetical protein